MNIEGSDLRVRMTKKMLVEAFLRLRKQKPLRRITVSELCSEAGVGRGTFYAHYQDVYDLNERLEGQFLEEFSVALRDALEHQENIQSARRVCRVVFAKLAENEPLCALLLAPDNAEGALRFIEQGGKLCAEYYKKFFGSTPPARLGDFYRFISSGCIACFKGWLHSDIRPPIEQFADEMSEFITRGVRALLQESVRR